MFVPEDTKYIHLIWVGDKPVFDVYRPSVDKFCPKGYKVHLWTNDEVLSLCRGCRYFDRNYEKGNWAFCSDYARFKILYEYGGIYIDTDVEFINPIDDVVDETFFATELVTRRVTSGLIMCLKEPHNEVIKKVLESYESSNAEYIIDGELLSGKLTEYGYVRDDKEQTLTNGIKIYKGGVFDWNASITTLPREEAKAVHHYTHLYETYHFNNNN